MEQISFIEQENVEALHTHTHTSIPLNVKFHCFFEQSGTFKNEFKKLGYNAYDYDILNDFGETDYVIDLFNEIDKAYEGKESLFDTIGKEDYILAFFPCTRFEAQILLSFRGDARQQKKWSDEQKLEYDLQLHKELHTNYEMITKLTLVAIKRNLKLIIENPYTEQHYLNRYWCIKSTMKDLDRTIRGDYYKKPTQYFFINCKPTYRPLFESQVWLNEKKTISDVHDKVERSMIHKDYANRFIREFIL